MEVDLSKLAYQVMLEKGLQPEYSKEELNQLSNIKCPALPLPKYTDLRNLLWCSIDNDDSLDLDQLTYAEKLDDDRYVIWVAIADVDALVKKNSPIDLHAQINTTSVYTPTKIFAMLPEKLSTNYTSLNENEDRVAMVVKITLNAQGDLENSAIFQAVVRNSAKLAYPSVSGWLEKKDPMPPKIKIVPGLANTLILQHQIAQILRQRRAQEGSLTLHVPKTEVKIKNSDFEIESPSQDAAQQLIEEFMIIANRAGANYFKEAKIASLRRVVRTPQNWDQIVKVAHHFGEQLSPKPDAKALDQFLIKRLKMDPDSFPDLSLTIVKLLGRGEYVVENITDTPIGHFALAVTNYTHSTAPNRRFPDLISQRQYKASLNQENQPYTLDELHQLAAHCTQQEDAAMKVERRLNKSAAAALLTSHIGNVYKGIVTGASEKGTWIRIFNPAIEGKLVKGFEKLKVGEKISVRLVNVDIEKGFIDFSQ